MSSQIFQHTCLSTFVVIYLSIGWKVVGIVSAFTAFTTRTYPLAPPVAGLKLRLQVVEHPFSTSTSALYALRNNSGSNSNSKNVDVDIQIENDINFNNLRNEKKKILMDRLSSVPSNVSTPKQLTSDILSAVRDLEQYCPMSIREEDEKVLSSLAGNWELLWTAQDKSTKEGSQSPIFNWINPLENQSYSNNPNGSSSSSSSSSQSQPQLGGRSNPILPQNIQNALEDLGILNNPMAMGPGLGPGPGQGDLDTDVDGDSGSSSGSDSGRRRNNTSPARSSQAIDLKNKRVRNVVSFEVKNPLKAPTLPLPLPLPPPLPLPFISRSGAKTEGNRKTKTETETEIDIDTVSGFLTVDVNFEPNPSDARRIDVKFDACRLSIQNSPLDINFPLGIIGPTGWLRTGYIDEDIRITRGHKGSVFILSRTSRRRES